jgi:hypothetical protein
MTGPEETGFGLRVAYDRLVPVFSFFPERDRWVARNTDDPVSYYPALIISGQQDYDNGNFFTA